MNEVKVKEQITNWLKNYVIDNKIKGFVIGVSGGIDSALTSTLCAETGLPTIVVEMPIHQDPSHMIRSSNHIKWLKENYGDNVKSYRISLDKTYNSLISDTECFPHGEGEINLTRANAKARLRMTTLYMVAQSNSSIVVGTGNKVEDFGIGFYTKYGDGGVDISPIGDLMKSEVYQLSKHMNIIQEILDAKPSDGLWEHGTGDEDIIGATYDELEWAMTYEGNGDEINDREREVLEIYRTMNRANKHKMVPIPVCKIIR